MANGNEYVKLENRLVLVAWLNSLFGYKHNKDLLADLREAGEGFDGEGHSYVVQRLLSRDKCTVPEADLRRYDANIQTHLAALNKRRTEPITLRYFQHLALLYTEIFLDRCFNHPGKFRVELREFVNARNGDKASADPPDSQFEPSDLTKLAYWMATGSGKTHLLHFNYRQFLHYNKAPLDNILLITPNEGLSQQHLEKMQACGIPCERFDLEESGLGHQNTVRVIEITKLVEEKKGGGVSVPVEYFEGNNLIFVDEGHKGTGGEVYRKFRDRLGATGFTFEYSATFGQALTAARDDALTKEYGKAILFDYSYKYFYGDGYGKDFHILNLRQQSEHTDTLLLANLLSFHEQKHFFASNGDKLRSYHIAMPLWVFVGSSVNAVYTKDKEKRSDVLTVVRFLHRFLENKSGWAVNTIDKIIKGESGLDNDGKDFFKDELKYLRAHTKDAAKIYSEILAKVFHAGAGGRLHLASLRGGSGELGLKVSGAESYFGLIYIGDVSAFKNLVEADSAEIKVEEDAISEPFFEQINKPESGINVLIGAKKFMEGWDSWRVSNMGLLNIGRSEGSEIIQLFGRGVRLRGLKSSLKRSSALSGEHPANIKLLETLNIFAIRANYMAEFRSYLEREGVDPDGHIELPLSIKPNKQFLKQGLIAPRLPSESDFVKQCDFLLDPEEAAKATVDMSIKMDSMRSGTGGVQTHAIVAGEERVISSNALDWLDWQKLHLELLDYKEQKGFSNLVIPAGVPQAVMTARDPRLYRLIGPKELVSPQSFSDVLKLHDTVLAILRKYVDRFYRVRQQRWDSHQMVYAPLTVQDANFQYYRVRVPRSEPDLIKSIKALIEEGERIYAKEVHDLPNIHFDRHLYQPLLIERGDKVRSTPRGLNESEEQFVRDLRDYFKQEQAKSLANTEIFLLRNLSRGKGVGFFENEGFYPDFILWIKNPGAQRLIFVEPHGMRQESSYWVSDKAQLHTRLQTYGDTGLKKAKLKNLTLDSFIISKTDYDELRNIYGDGSWSRQQFTASHILFFDRDEHYDYVRHLLA